jgi:hypothetical protein
MENMVTNKGGKVGGVAFQPHVPRELKNKNIF